MNMTNAPKFRNPTRVIIEHDTVNMLGVVIYEYCTPYTGIIRQDAAMQRVVAEMEILGNPWKAM